MKKTLILLFSFLFIFASTFPVKASEIQSINSTNIIEIFDDGSYIESSTEENIVATLSRSLLKEHIHIKHLVEKFYGQLLLLELLHITDHPQAVLKPPYLLRALPLLLNWLQNQQQSTTPLQLRLLHLNSTMIQYI